jgi:peptide-methionine (S)-S-oxide reductase
VVTEVVMLETFYPADDYHKNYYERNGNNIYCQLVINPKLKKVEEQFAALINDHEGQTK